MIVVPLLPSMAAEINDENALENIFLPSPYRPRGPSGHAPAHLVSREHKHWRHVWAMFWLPTIPFRPALTKPSITVHKYLISAKRYE